MELSFRHSRLSFKPSEWVWTSAFNSVNTDAVAIQTSVHLQDAAVTTAARKPGESRGGKGRVQGDMSIKVHFS